MRYSFENRTTTDGVPDSDEKELIQAVKSRLAGKNIGQNFVSSEWHSIRAHFVADGIGSLTALGH